MEIACRCGTASPSAMSAVLSMPPVYRVGRNGPLRVPDGCDGCDGCGRTLPGITEPARKAGHGRRRVRRWRGLRTPRFRRVRGRPFAGRPAAGLSAPARAREPFCDPRWLARTQGPPKSVDKPLSWEGQPAPRLYGFTARHVAKALTLVAGGTTYRQASASIRAEAGRPLSMIDGKTSTGRRLAAANRHGQLVSDWVDTFAPVIWDAYAPKQWPPHLLLDSDDFRYKAAGQTRGVHAFHVLAALGYDARGRRVVARLEAVRRENTQVWEGFLRRLPGTPEVVLTDGGLTGTAAGNVWPHPGDAAPALLRCEWHLARNLTQSLPEAVQRDQDDPLHAFVGRALNTITDWNALVNEVHARAVGGGYARALNTIAGLDKVVTGQLAIRGRGWPRSPGPLAIRGRGRPRSPGPLEQFFRTLENTIGDRAARMTNKARADALLMLLAAQHNGWVDEREWAEHIRAYLAQRRGLAPDQRRHTDPASSRSLR